MVERYKVELGRAIAKRRTELGMTQKDLADATHYKEAQSVSRWERGENVPSDLEVVAHALKWTLNDLVAGIEVPNRKIARQFGLPPPATSTPDLAAALSSDATQLDRIERMVMQLLAHAGLAPAEEDPAEVVADVTGRLADAAGSPQQPAHGQPRSRPAASRRKSA